MTIIPKKETDTAARVLAGAFMHDPLFEYFFPDEKQRAGLSFYTFRFITAHAVSKGSVYSTSPGIEGVSIWLPSSMIERGLIAQLRFGVLRMLFSQGREALNRQISASSHMRALHCDLLPENHLYLSTIGIAKEFRGLGLASGLMDPGLAMADSKNLPCYLDTHNENNLGLYERYGFRVAAESVIPGTGVRHWAMIRDRRLPL